MPAIPSTLFQFINVMAFTDNVFSTT